MEAVAHQVTGDLGDGIVINPDSNVVNAAFSNTSQEQARNLKGTR